jgi:DNA-binding transcriptional MerR regulator
MAKRFGRLQVAKTLGMSTEGVRHLQKAGELHSRRDEKGHHTFDPDEVQRLKLARTLRGVTPRLNTTEQRQETAERKERRRLKREEEAAAKAQQGVVDKINAEADARNREWHKREREEVSRARMFLSEAEAASALGLWSSELLKLSDSGRLRHVDTFFERRYARDDVEAVGRELKELSNTTVSLDEAKCLLHRIGAEVRRLARHGAIRSQIDLLGNERYNREDVMRIRQEAEEAKQRPSNAEGSAEVGKAYEEVLLMLEKLRKKF